MSGPRLTEKDLLALDRRLRELHAALTARPLRPYGYLADEAREVLRSVERQLANDGREKEAPGRWCWAREWRDLHGTLTWGRFGSQNVPVWRALREAFTELIRFVLDPETPRQQRLFAQQLAVALESYLDLREPLGQPTRARGGRRARRSYEGEVRKERVISILLALTRAGGRLLGRVLAGEAGLPADRHGRPNSRVRRLFRELVEDRVLDHDGDGYGLGPVGRQVVAEVSPPDGPV